MNPAVPLGWQFLIANARHGTQGLRPWNLAAALPHRLYTFAANGRRHELRFSDAAAVGTVDHIEKGIAFVRTDQDDVIEQVDFDDDSAIERAVDVHLTVDHYFDSSGAGEQEPPNSVSFRWGGLGRMSQEQQSRYLAALHDLGRLVVFLRQRNDPDRAVFIPALGGQLLGHASEADQLTFPLMHDELRFRDGIENLGQLRDAAAQSVGLTTIDPERGRPL